jgi:hypothetical protein
VLISECTSSCGEAELPAVTNIAVPPFVDELATPTARMASTADTRPLTLEYSISLIQLGPVKASKRPEEWKKLVPYARKTVM